MNRLMPPQIASQVTRLPLTKFSHTTTTISHSVPLSWTHVNGNGDLVCILEQIPAEHSVPSRLVLRVARNDGILEQIDLAHFVRMSAAQSQNVQNALQSKPLFAVVVKSPCLAVKYPQSSMHIRRFQIKFSQNTDYFTALALLSGINCPLTEGSTSMLPPRRPPSSVSWSSLQVPNSVSKEASTTVTSDVDTTVPFFPVPGHIPSGMSTPNPPSSSSSIIYNPIGPTAPIIQNPFESTTLQSNPQAPSLHPKLKAPESHKNRPATVQAFYDDQLNQMLPPKRDLPFLKLSQKNSQRGDPATSMTSQFASTSQPLIEASKDEQQSPLAGHEIMPVLRDSQISDSQSQSQSQSLVPTQSLHNTLQREPLLSQSHASRPAVENHLSAYLDAQTPERIAFLENWMCELIEDDGFMALCQDIEVTWRRFAFGIRK